MFSLLTAAIIWISADAQMVMRQLSVNEGLSQYYVSDIEQDKYGFIWIATYDGLNRFDGAGIKVYKSEPDDPRSLSSNRIKALYFDKESDRLFIGTDGGGINVYDYASESFRCYHIGHNSNRWLPENDIIDIEPDENGKMWIATRKVIFLTEITENDIIVRQRIDYPTNRVINSLIYYDGALITVAKHRVIRYVLSSDGVYTEDADIPFPGKAEINSVSIYENSMLFSTTSGLYCLQDPRHGTDMQRFHLSSSGCLPDNADIAAVKETDGKFIIIANGKGLFSYDRRNGSVEPIPTVNDRFWEDNTVRNAMIDRAGTMWIASTNKGAAFIDLNQSVFSRIPLYDGGQPFISALSVSCDNALWVGTENKGLFIKDSSDRISNILKKAGPVTDIGTFRDGSIKIVCDGKVFSWNNGELHKVFPSNHDWAAGMGTVFNICEDRYGTMWLGCRKGIAGIRDGKHVIIPIETNFYLKAFPSRSRDALWVCTGRNGLIKYKIDPAPSLSVVKHYTNSAADTSSISSNTVRAVLESSAGPVYVGTEAGMYIIDPKTLVLKKAKSEGIMANSNVLSICEDRNGILWAGTSKGLVRYDPADGSERIYDSSDGLASSYVTAVTAFPDSDTLYVGTNEGANCFLTAGLPGIDNIPTQIAVSGFKVFGKEMTFDTPVMETDRIVLPHNQNSVTFLLSVLSYSNPQKNRMFYRLKGWDDNWTETGINSPYATFNKLKKGHYTFEFKGTDSNSALSSDTVSIGLVIRPAWWDTIWAYCIYTAIAAALIYFIIIFFKERIRSKSEAEANEAKIRFYDNLTHELRTPLTLVAAPLSELADEKNLPENATYKISVIQSNVNRLLDLANRALDLRKIDSNRMPLAVRYQDITMLVKKMTDRFEPLASHRRVSLSLRIPEERMFGWADEEKVTTIVTNLLSNALKFTPEGGHVTVCLQHTEKECMISVTDDGCGIPDKEMEHIFKRFYQVEKRPVSGTGIGLDLSRALAELHKGWLKGKSRLGEGSTFTFGFPYFQEAYSPDERDDTCEEMSVQVSDPQETSSGDNRPMILVVDDDFGMSEYIRSVLKPVYRVLTAENGQKGIESSLKNMPDMIISDVMMPVMDGIEMCRRISDDFRTSHIPVILLTAKNDELSGLRAGAVDYIMKPFEPKSLLLKIENLLKYKASVRLSQNPDKSIVQKIREYSDQKEKEFLERTCRIIEENLGNGDFRVEDLMKELGVSKSQLHKKITALTGQPASALIRNIRLDKAREMLSTGRYSITEVLYSAGFNSPSYFSKMFRERFGVLPSDMLQDDRS